VRQEEEEGEEEEEEEEEADEALFAFRNTRTCANERGEVQTPSRVADSNHEPAGQHPGLPRRRRRRRGFICN